MTWKSLSNKFCVYKFSCGSCHRVYVSNIFMIWYLKHNGTRVVNVTHYIHFFFLEYILACSTCGKVYKYRKSLLSHQQFECSNERRFSCSKCQIRFRRKCHLSRHIQNKSCHMSHSFEKRWFEFYFLVCNIYYIYLYNFNIECYKYIFWRKYNFFGSYR